MLTPLNGIVGMLELLAEHAHTDTTRSYVTTAQASTDRLGTLVRRLLDLVELRSGRLRPEPSLTRLGSIADHVTARWQVKTLQTGQLLTVRVDGDHADEIWVDELRVRQIVDELIGNVVIHADPGVVEVTISVDAPAAETGDSSPQMLRVAVVDAGPGFDRDPLADFWSTFAKVDLSPQRATEGAGIGLGLTDQLATAMGGRREVESALGQSTRAVLIVPTTGPNAGANSPNAVTGRAAVPTKNG